MTLQRGSNLPVQFVFQFQDEALRPDLGNLRTRVRCILQMVFAYQFGLGADQSYLSWNVILMHYTAVIPQNHGMPGLNAYSSLYVIGKPKKGETIFVSAASGAVGQLVGQLAKHKGLRVIGSVGSKEKLEHITKELGFDGSFNYKNGKPADPLARLTPEGLDIYYEHVGAEQLEAALDNE